ncbi:unnamed protein product, partial [Heterotrigona itama]
MAGSRRSVCALFQVKVHARLSTKQKERKETRGLLSVSLTEHMNPKNIGPTR